MTEEEDTVSPEVYEHISRGALLAGIVLSIAYAVSGIIIFIVVKPSSGVDPMWYIAASLPLIVGAILGSHQMWLKWIRYTFSDRHVQVTLIGVSLSATMAAVAYFWPLQVTTAGVFFFPVAQLCVSLVMLGYPLTHSHKFSLASSAMAISPVFMFFVISMYGFFSNQAVGFGTPLLAVLYLFSGVLMSLAGSLHHMGTISTTFVRVERVVEVDEGEIKVLKKDIETRDAELRKIERLAGSLKEITLDNYKKNLANIEGDSATLGAMKLGALSLVQNVRSAIQDQTVSIREVERLTAKEKMLQQKETDLITREKNISDKLAELTKKSSDATIAGLDIKKKEDALSMREMEVTAKERDAAAKEENVKRALKEADEKYEEAKKASESLKERELAIESSKKEIQTKEEQLKTKEEQLRSKEEQLIKGSSNIAVQKDGLKAREDSLAKREQEIKAREEAVALKDRELSAMPYDDMKRMKEELTVKEVEIRSKESEISLLRAKLDESQKSLDARASDLRSTKVEYDASISKLGTKEQEIEKKEEELQLSKVKLETRERELAMRESDFEKKAGPMHSHARAEERAHKLIERLKMSKEMDERMEGQREAEGPTEEPAAPQPSPAAEVRPMTQAASPPSQQLQPAPQRPSLPLFMTPKPKEPSPPPSPQQSSPDQVPEPRPGLPPYMKLKAREAPPRPQTPEPSAPKDEVLQETHEREQPKSHMDRLDGMFRSAILDTKQEVQLPRISTGIERMDELMGGGMPAGTMVLLSAEAYVGCDAFIHNLVSNSLDEGIQVIYISTRRGVEEVYSSLLAKNPRVADYAALGSIKWLDLFSPAPVQVPFMQHVSTMRLEVVSMTEVFLQVDARAGDGCIVVVDSASPLITRGKFEVFVRDIASCIKKRKGTAIFRIEPGMHTEQDIENLRHIIHGCVSFKKEGTKTLLQVEGMPGAKSGNWVEYQIKDGDIVLGSFAIERIS